MLSSALDGSLYVKLIIGLGNPGTQYARTRHNFGFVVVDALATTLGASFKPVDKLRAAVAEVPDHNLIIAKPATFMNLSGESVQRLMQRYKIAATDIIAVFDDVDVPFGRLRVRVGGSSGGHQGVSSIIRSVGDKFLRVKVGISLNDRSVEPSEVYVLKPFTKEEQERLPSVAQAAAAIVLELATSESTSETTFKLN
jgi:peptidyl-tRNA hydrolase, PTH1 family